MQLPQRAFAVVREAAARLLLIITSSLLIVTREVQLPQRAFAIVRETRETSSATEIVKYCRKTADWRRLAKRVIVIRYRHSNRQDDRCGDSKRSNGCSYSFRKTADWRRLAKRALWCPKKSPAPPAEPDVLYVTCVTCAAQSSFSSSRKRMKRLCNWRANTI